MDVKLFLSHRFFEVIQKEVSNLLKNHSTPKDIVGILG